MRIRKCNFCGKIIDNKKDKYYSIGDIEFHAPDSKFGVRLTLSKDEESTYKTENIESWLNYCDLDFCEDCWEQVDIQRFL